MSDYQTLKFSIENSVGIIKFNRPDSANGLNMQMANELMQVAIQCEENADIRAVLLTANGKMFSAVGHITFCTYGCSCDNCS